MVHKFAMEGATPTKFPIAGHFKLLVDMSPKNEEEAKEMEKVTHVQVMGSIMYSMVSTRLD